MRDFDGKIDEIESGLDDTILALRRKGVLNYPGAVELQSHNTRIVPWKVSPVLDVELSGPLYGNWFYAKGQIWCRNTNSNMENMGGSDEIAMDAPLLHSHMDTKAETLTGALAKNFGGGQLIGEFTVGSKHLLTQGKGYGPS